MVANSVKLNLVSLDYYLLKIDLETNLEQIEAKLLNLRKFDDSGTYIVVEFLAQSTLDKLSILVQKLKMLALKCNFEIKFILANKYVTASDICGIHVVELRTNAKSREVISQPLKINNPIRSGIKIEHESDIVILNLVSNNAEVVAGGSIHIYGDARGRLIAGSNGDKTARIFVQRFNPELISIAGVFRVLEDDLPPSLHNKSVQVFLDEKERLNISPL